MLFRSIGLLLIWLVTLIAFINARSKKIVVSNKQENKKQKNQKQLAESQGLKNLTQAIKEKQAISIESCLLKWASNLSSTPIISLGQLISYLTELSVKEKLNQLQSSRYSSTSDQFESDISKDDLQHIASILQAKELQKTDNKIPPLYS